MPTGSGQATMATAGSCARRGRRWWGFESKPWRGPWGGWFAAKQLLVWEGGPNQHVDSAPFPELRVLSSFFYLTHEDPLVTFL